MYIYQFNHLGLIPTISFTVVIVVAIPVQIKEKMNKEETREYMRLWHIRNKDRLRESRREYRKEYQRKWNARHPERKKEIDRKAGAKRRFGSVERYNEAMLKYEGECAFACGRQAEMVHHINGKSIRNTPNEEINNNLSNLLPLCIGCHTWLHKIHLHRRGK